jgi:hypothetical protein
VQGWMWGALVVVWLFGSCLAALVLGHAWRDDPPAADPLGEARG